MNNSYLSATGNPDTEGVVITHIGAGGYFEEQGLWEFDVIRYVNGVKIKDIHTLYSVFSRMLPGSKTDMIVRRNQSNVVVRITTPLNGIVLPWQYGGTTSGNWLRAEGFEDFTSYNAPDQIMYTTRDGDSLTYEFYGSGIDVLSAKDNDCGYCDVYIDGVFVERVDTNSPSLTYGSVVFSKKDLPLGEHELKLVNVENGRRNRMVIDAFRIYTDPGPKDWINGKRPQVLSFQDISVTVAIDGTVVNPLDTSQAPGNAAIVYTSSNTSVAEVNGSTGEIVLHSIGSAIIQAVKPADDRHEAATAAYVLRVTAYSEGAPDPDPPVKPEPEDPNGPDDRLISIKRVTASDTLVHPSVNVEYLISTDEFEPWPTNDISNTLFKGNGYKCWVTNDNPDNVWVLLELEQVEDIDRIFIWNNNHQYESLSSRGFKDITITYSADSTDGTNGTWETLGSYELPAAPGDMQAIRPQFIEEVDRPARFVKILAHSNYGAAPWGLGKIVLTKKPTQIPLRSIRLNKTDMEICEGETEKLLSVIYEPAFTTDSTEVTWISSDESVATVSQNGVITATGAGLATITATVGDLEATCVLNVVKMREEGDVDGDGLATVSDVVELRKLIVAGAYHAVGDMNADAALTVADVVELRRVIVAN